MASQLSSRKGEPAKDELDRIVRSLSTDFQLQLHIPDLTLSPSKRRQQHRNGDQERSEHIYLCAYRLKFQDPNRLAICLTRFREQADEHLKNWIRKPRADPDTAPSKSFGPHRPHTRLTSEERAELQDFLLQLLKDDNIANRQRSKYSKRKSDEFPDPSSKKSRNSFEGSPACESIDSIPVRSRAVASSSRLSTGRPARGAGTSSFTNGIVNSATTSFASTQPSSFGIRSFNSSKVSLAPTVSTNDYAPSTQATTVTNTSFKRSQHPFQSTQPSFSSNATSSKDIQGPFSQSIRRFAYQPPSEENRNDIDPPKPPSFRRYGDRTPPEPVIDLTDDDEPMEEPRLPVLSMPQPIRSQVDLKRAGIFRSSSPATAYSSLPEMNEFDTMLLDAPIFDPEPPECPLTDRLRNIWPKFPIPGLNQAPLIILWELTRAALHCRVDLSTWDLEYQPNDSWHDQTNFRGQLFRHRLFVGQGLPAACDRAVWDAAFGSFASQDKVVVLAAEFVCNAEDTGQLYRLKLQPPRLELGHRLARRFGADRFLEVIMPSPTSRDAPDVIKQDPQGANKVIKWLTESFHYFVGRSWAAFYTREANKSIKDPRPPHKSLTIMQERVYFFATDGINFRVPMSQFPPLEEVISLGHRTKMRRCDLLNWAINIEQNSSQPVPKLFSRLALSLSKTVPTIVIEPHQFRHRDTMLGFHKYMSNKEKKEQKDMGDGIGRVSRNLARRIATHMGLLETPCAFQARIGSAKGMWIVDVEDDGLDNDDWIETYPSQRKWNCDFEDVHHRTFEVREWSRELRSAALNTQFIPVLEAQAPVPQDMRNVIARHLANGLQEEIGGQLAAMTHPTNLRGFTHRGFDRATLGNVPFVGALPEREEDIISYMLDAGFDATKCRFLRDMVWNNQKRQADQLKAKMNIKIPRSTYAFMTVDFTGTLEEGEVQLAFSSKFQADGESDTLLDGIDILVARAPAHFVSDIQKVKAVFRPNLKRLKDVIVFSSKGKSPLADMLSGGDYDGDLAWICWDPDVVNNFNNAPKPFKEKLCYLERGVNSERAVALSTLVALLVDQAKQGLLFTREDYDRLKRDMQMKGKDPEYENERSSRRNYVNRDGSIHILDELKFIVAEDTIEDALKKFSAALFGKDVPVQAWDKDLARLWDDFESQKNESRIIGRLMTALRAQVSDIMEEWKKTMAGGKSDPSNSDFSVKVRELHQKWSSFQPPPELLTSRQVKPLLDKWNSDASLSKWELLKASTMFKLGYEKSYKMVWRLSGKQLAWMKAMMPDGSAVAVKIEMWSILRPDNKRIAALNARRQIGHDNESLAALEEVTEYDETGMQIDDA
ncbi:Putative RNA-dependent RNA polymerase 2 [Fusarium oxysporum f. sp. cubense race 1]|uniref:RNA-dependent RNA polymerase n=1 Tax=Fusarium oxysporum f. sp. cubense (strain race 1) TaxID=1229664 RepID=N4U3T6_FUSC1|nr:Putative RNA-dependent RNA polymerase 2 [Fusarium oxysporum f. sp. cubense race 1]